MSNRSAGTASVWFQRRQACSDEPIVDIAQLPPLVTPHAQSVEQLNKVIEEYKAELAAALAENAALLARLGSAA